MAVYVDFEPATICVLAECGQFTRQQFLSLMGLCSDQVVRSVLEELNDSTLRAFFMDPEDFETFLETLIAALGEEEVLRRAKQWLVDASKARAKEEIVRCSNIINSIVSHQAKRRTAPQQVLNPLHQPEPPSVHIPPSKARQERLPLPGTAAQPEVTLPSTSIQPLTVAIPSTKTGDSSNISPPSPSQERPSARSPSPPRVPQPFPLDVPQATQARLSRSPKHAAPPSPLSPTRQLRDLPINSSPSAKPSEFNPSSLSLIAKDREVVVGAGSVPVEPDLGGHGPAKRSGPSADRTTVPSPPHIIPPAQDTLENGTIVPNPLHDSGVRQIARRTAASSSEDPLEAGVLEDLDEAIEQDGDAEMAVADPVIQVSSANPWDAATNAEKVKEWRLEDMIQDNPRHTSPFRTEWMYEDRKKATNKNDTEYQALTDQEYSRLAEVPAAVRGHAGLVYNKKSKFDWEVRVVLGRLAYDYSQMDEPENSKFLHDSLLEIESRFPDISPDHIFRQIDRDGPKAVQKWRSDMAKWVQTTAGKMSGTHQNLEHRVEILNAKKSSKKFDAYQLLGLKRAEVNYVMWGRTTEGKKKCNPLIDAEMELWKAEPENQKATELDSKVFGQHRVKVQARVRRHEFGRLSDERQNEFSQKSKSKNGEVLLSDEDIQAAAECLLSHLNQVVGDSATVANLHIVLLASGVISGGRLPVIMKEFGVKPSQGPFLKTHEVGGRAKAEYPNYVSARFQADPSELEILDQGGDDIISVDDEEPLLGEPKSKSKGKAKGKAADLGRTRKPAGGKLASSRPESHPVLSQWKPLATVNTNSKRAEYMSRFLARTFKLHFPSKISWHKVSAENERYIEPQRRPRDLNDQAIQLMNPLAMPVETHLNPWWDFMQECAQGRVSAERIFCWRPETTRLAIPSIPVPADPDVHMSGELARTANPKKRPRVPKESSRKAAKRQPNAKPPSEDPELELETDLESLEEADQDGLDAEPPSPRILRSRPIPRVPSAAAPFNSDNDDDDESGSSGSEFEAEDQPQSRGLASTSRRNPELSDKDGASSSRAKPLRVPFLEAEGVDHSTPENILGSGSPPPLNDEPPPQLPPLSATIAAPQSYSQSTTDASLLQSTVPPQTSSGPIRTAPQQPTVAPPPTDPASNTSGKGMAIGNISSDASAGTIPTSRGPSTKAPGKATIVTNLSSHPSTAINSSSEAPPSKASGNAVAPGKAKPGLSSSISPAPTDLPSKSSGSPSAPANATPVSSSGNHASTSEDAPSKSSGNPIAPSNAVLSPTLPLPFTELRLVHPRMFSGKATASGSPGWLQVKPLWTVWGNKVAFLNVDQCDLALSAAFPKPDVAVPSALTSAVSITQIYVALQRPDPHTPDVPSVQVSSTCRLDDLHPHHHLRQVVEGILNVMAPLPSSKVFESNLLLSIEAVHAFFGALEGSLASFIDELTANEETIRYAEIEFFTSLRLALYVKGTTFIRDEGGSGPSIERVESLLDRLVSVLAGVAVLRYMQEYLGGALERWTREEPEKSSSRWEMWYSFLQLWKAGMSSLASALSQGRQDLFQYRAINTIISPSVKSIVDHLMVNPAWWSPPGDGVPVAFRVGLKQFIPSDSLFEQLPQIQWPRLSFLDRTSVLLLLFICAIQLSQEPDSSTRLKSSVIEESPSLVSLFVTCCRGLKQIIEDSVGTEEGPKYSPDNSDSEVRRRKMVEAWLKVWQSERGPGGTTMSPGSSTKLPWAKDTLRIPQEMQEPMDLTGEEGDHQPEAAGGLAPIPEEVGAQPPNEEEGSDSGTNAVTVTKAKGKRKVPVGGRRIAGPSVGVADNPRQRLKEVAAKAPEKESEDRPRRKQYISSPYASTPQASGSKEASHPIPEQEPAHPPKSSSSKKPKASKTKTKALASSSAPSSSPRKLTKRQQAVEVARKAADAKTAKKMGTGL